jgi:hypothetical protein
MSSPLAAPTPIGKYGTGAAPPPAAPAAPPATATPVATVVPAAGLLGLPTTSDLTQFLFKATFVVTGLALVALGFWRISEPARAKVSAAAQSVPVPV